MTNAAPTPLSAIQALTQYPLLSTNNYALLVISRNDKNKQLILLSQRQLALAAINFVHYKLFGAPKKFKNQLHPLVSPSSVNFSHEKVPLMRMIDLVS